MDWSKVDAGLAGALADDDAGRRYAVFVHLDPEADPEVLGALGVAAAGRGAVRTATVSAADVARLTDEAGVRHLRLSTPLHLTDGT